MNFYPHHISDFNNATRYLTRVERSVYRDAIEMYYDTESVLTKDFSALSRRLLCTTDEEKEALKVILEDFFIDDDDGYRHIRCDEEIEKYRLNTSAKARAGIASAEARKRKKQLNKQKLTRVEHTLNTCATNQEPITNNHKPLIKEKYKKENPQDLLDGISDQVKKDFITLRKQKKASITKTAVDGLRREADKANISLETALIECCQRGWIGFKADWYLKTNKANAPNVSNLEEYNKQQTEIARQKLFGKQEPEERDITHEARTF